MATNQHLFQHSKHVPLNMVFIPGMHWEIYNYQSREKKGRLFCADEKGWTSRSWKRIRKIYCEATREERLPCISLGLAPEDFEGWLVRKVVLMLVLG